MTEENENVPLMKFESNASAPILRYDIPSPSSYEGKFYIELKDFDQALFKDGLCEAFDYYDFLENNREDMNAYLSSVLKNELLNDIYRMGFTEGGIVLQSYSGGFDFNKYEIGTTGDQIDFVHDCDTTQNTSIHEGMWDHTKILQQTNRGSKDKFYHKFESSQLAGIREFWLLLEDSSKETQIIFREIFGDTAAQKPHGEKMIYLHIIREQLTYVRLDAENKEIFEKIMDISSNTWYHVKIQWFQDNTFRITILGDTKIHSGGSLYKNMVNGLDGVTLRVYNTTTYLDAFADPAKPDYNEGDNFLDKKGQLYKLLEGWKMDYADITPELIMLLKLLPEDDVDIFKAKYQIFNYYVQLAMKPNEQGDIEMWPVFYRTMGGNLRVRFFKVKEIYPRIILIDTVKLTSFPGDYGAGTTIKTFSLLPREETDLSIKTWKETEETTKEASSILDSYTTEKADEFEKNVQKENSRTDKVEESNSFHAEAGGGVSWGVVSASASTGTESSSSSSREEMSKNVLNTTSKQSQKASAKREVNIDTSYERSTKEGIETYIMRRIQNLNASRTLNFTFRQLNQQYHSLLHLTDVRISFYNGYPGSIKEYALYELDDFVRIYMKEPVATNITNLKEIIYKEYGEKERKGKVFDYRGDPRQFIEKIAAAGTDNYEYFRVIPSKEIEELDGKIRRIGQQDYAIRPRLVDSDGNETPADLRYVDGIIIGKKVLTMRTDGVVVEALLGQATALDKYALDIQTQEVRNKTLENNKIQVGLRLVNTLIKENKIEAATNAYKEMFTIKEGMRAFTEVFNKQKYIIE